jgi:hypothetical protein
MVIGFGAISFLDKDAILKGRKQADAVHSMQPTIS